MSLRRAMMFTIGAGGGGTPPVIENLITDSEGFITGWYPAGVSINPYQVPASDGRMVGAEVTINAGAHYLFQQFGGLDPGEAYTFGFDIKRGTATNFNLSVYSYATGELIPPTSYYAQSNSSTWVRVSVTFTVPAVGGAINVYPFRDGGATGTVYLSRPQLNKGTALGPYKTT